MNIINEIKTGNIDINNQQNFFSTLIKGFIYNLSNNIKLRGEQIDHFILNSGDDIMYLENKGHNMSLEPLEISNEDYIYNKIPRGIVEVGGINLLGDQLTNPYTRGDFEFEYDNIIYSLSAEFRRMPVKLSITIKYWLDSYTDTLEIAQQIIKSLAFVKTFKIIYMGKTIMCSYQIPDAFNSEKNITIDGGTTESKYKTLQLDFEIESNYPIFEQRTVINNDNMIKTIIHEQILPNNEIQTNIIK